MAQVDAYVTPARRPYDGSGSLIKHHDDRSRGRNDTDIVIRRTRYRSYSNDEKICRSDDDDRKYCIERKITYRDGYGNIIRIVYEDSCGKVIRTVYPKRPHHHHWKCDCSSSEATRKCVWKKYVVRDSCGYVWKITWVDCYGKTMKTEYPECGPPRRRCSDTKRIQWKDCSDDDVERRRYSETRKYYVDRNSNVRPLGTEVVVKTSDETSSKHSRNDSAVSSGTSSKDTDEVVEKDENGVTKKVTYTDSRGRRRTVVYDD